MANPAKLIAMQQKPKAIFSWSGGKDSAYCLHKVLSKYLEYTFPLIVDVPPTPASFLQDEMDRITHIENNSRQVDFMVGIFTVIILIYCLILRQCVSCVAALKDEYR